MFTSLILAVAFQVLPFYQQKPEQDFYALRPFWSHEAETTDVLWPLFTSHRDWWRLCLFTHYQSNADGGYQFDILPLWWNGVDGRRKREEGRSADDSSYWGLFPIYGRHPHVLTLYDWEFVLWPVWMRYRMPRPKDQAWLTTNAVLFPFFHWRDDGAWGFWPFYVTSHNRADDHTTVLWPLWNWKTSFADRDTGGAGTSWMLWPLLGRVARERESQWLFLPPFFSYAETRSRVDAERGNSAPRMRVRCPWPFIEWESSVRRWRLSLFPIYERIEDYRYADGAREDSVTRWLWKGVEIYRGKDEVIEETRVFPFWVKNATYFRLWPFYESTTTDRTGDETYSRVLGLFPIRWVEAVDRNWSAFWTFYESLSNPVCTDHSLFWGLIKWRTLND